MKPIISENLTPYPPSLQGNGDFKASPLAGERFGEGSVYTLKTFQTSSKNLKSLDPRFLKEVGDLVFYY